MSNAVSAMVFPMSTVPEQEGSMSPDDVEGGRKAEKVYAIPPILWMFVFLIGGYFGLRYMMED
jgi:hypothetical protein